MLCKRPRREVIRIAARNVTTALTVLLESIPMEFATYGRRLQRYRLYRIRLLAHMVRVILHSERLWQVQLFLRDLVACKGEGVTTLWDMRRIFGDKREAE